MQQITSYRRPWVTFLLLVISQQRLQLALVTWICIVCGVVSSHPVLAGFKTNQRASDAMLARLNKAFVAFEGAQKNADAKLLRGFDRAISEVKKDRNLVVGEKANLIREIEEAKSSFQVAHTLPVSDLLIPLSIEYLDRLQPEIAALQRLQREALEHSLDDPEMFEEFQRRQRQWESSLPGAGELSFPGRWHGRRVFRKDGRAVDFHLHLDTADNGILKGSVWQDAGNTWTKVGLAFEGRCEGNRVVITTTDTLHGNPRKLDLAGYVIERRLVLTVLSVNGKPVGDFVSMSK